MKGVVWLLAAVVMVINYYLVSLFVVSCVISSSDRQIVYCQK